MAKPSRTLGLGQNSMCRVTSPSLKETSTAGTVSAPRVARDTVPVTMQHERDNIYRVELRGMLRTTDLARCQERLVGEMGRIGPRRAPVEFFGQDALADAHPRGRNEWR